MQRAVCQVAVGRLPLPRLLVLILLLVQPLPSVLGQQVSLDRQCYRPGQGIWVTFSGADAVDDWVGFVSVASLNRNLIIQESDATVWAWKCGITTCPQTSGKVFVDNTLSPGEYVAVLVHGSFQGAYQGFATSMVLTVDNSCNGSTGTVPIAAPTSMAVPTRSVPAGSGSNSQAAQDLANARFMIERMIANDAGLAPKFLRLIFHDCLGGCDGCVDINNPDNFGLEKPIDALEHVFDQHGGIISRADIWALSATVAVDMVQSRHDAIEFPFRFWGREDCGVRDTCFGPTGQSVPCTPKFGPHRNHPSIHLNTENVYHFFATEFGFSAREAIVVTAGGHTIGKCTVAESGINGPNGWVQNNQVFDKGYFDEVIGGRRSNAPIEILVNDAPLWRRAVDQPHGPFQNRRFWEGIPASGKRFVMLNTDIGLFRDLNSNNYDEATGEAECGFEDDTSREASIPVCPHVENAVLIGAELKHDNLKFKTEFRHVLVKLVTTGYDQVSCNDEALCKLVKR